MSFFQQIIVLLFGLLNLIAFFKGYNEVKNKKNPFGIAKPFGFLGIFVWGDAIVIGLFWVIVSTAYIYINDWILFWLTISVFWSVRSAGEVIYWLNEQFAVHHRNAPNTLKFYTFFKNDSIWFVYQLFWQCVLVISIIASIYFSFVWINTSN